MSKQIEKSQALYMKEHIKVELLKGQHDRDMFHIDVYMDNILNAFDKEITWSEISPNPNEQLTLLRKTIARVKKITRRNQND